MTQSLAAHGGLVLFAVVFVDQAGAPLPAAPWLLAAGALAAGGKMNTPTALGISVVACLIADSLWFYVGRRGGDRVLSFFRRWAWVPDSGVKRTQGLVERHGMPGLVIAKFLPGLGSVVPPLAGALGVSTAQFLLFDGLGAVLYGAFYLTAGFLFHNQLHQALAVLKQLGLRVLLLALILVLAYIAFKYTRWVFARGVARAETCINESIASTMLPAWMKTEWLPRLKPPSLLREPDAASGDIGKAQPTISLIAHGPLLQCFSFARTPTKESHLYGRGFPRSRTNGIASPCPTILSQHWMGDGI